MSQQQTGPLTVIGVDTGGTFTDCVIVDQNGGVVFDKASSTPGNYAEGVLSSLEQNLISHGLELAELWPRLAYFAHGTTVPLNAFYTRTGSRTALLTTAGHEDAILIGRANQKVKGLGRDALTHVVRFDKPQPLVEREQIAGLNERVDWSGAVLAPLDEAELAERVAELTRGGAEALAVCLLWSFVNPAHERAIKERLARDHPDLFVTASSDVAPLLGEYERAVTTVLNAYVAPPTARYLQSLGQRLEEAGMSSPFLVMQSSGGVMPASEAGGRAVYLMSSGPAGGVACAEFLARARGDGNVVTTDVGGTSFDVGLIVDGRASVTSSAVYDRFEARVPSLDVTSIGAGGGSIAWVDALTGVLNVGPQSAGARPGPACYGLGGELPTVTDADLVLGRLTPEHFLGGRMRVRPDLAEAAIRRHVAEPLGLSVPEAALSIVTVIDAKMADLVRKVSIERGHDPRDFTIYAFGGGGPTHVGGYGPDTGMRQAVVSPYASAFSALGVAVAGYTRIYDRAHPVAFPCPAADLEGVFAGLRAGAERDAAAAGLQGYRVERLLSLRFRYQVHELYLPLPEGGLDEVAVQGIADRFHRDYERQYGTGTAYAKAGMEAVTCRLALRAEIAPLRLQPQPRGNGDIARAFLGSSPALFRAADGYVETPSYDGAGLRHGDVVEGPAVIQHHGASLVVHPGQRVEVDEYLNSVLTF